MLGCVSLKPFANPVPKPWGSLSNLSTSCLAKNQACATTSSNTSCGFGCNHFQQPGNKSVTSQFYWFDLQFWVAKLWFFSMLAPKHDHWSVVIIPHPQKRGHDRTGLRSRRSMAALPQGFPKQLVRSVAVCTLGVELKWHRLCWYFLLSMSGDGSSMLHFPSRVLWPPLLRSKQMEMSCDPCGCGYGGIVSIDAVLGLKSQLLCQMAQMNKKANLKKKYIFCVAKLTWKAPRDCI